MDKKILLVLIVISSIQTVLLSYLIFNPSHLEVTHKVPDQNLHVSEDESIDDRDVHSYRAPNSEIDEATIRKIIRQELSAYAKLNSESDNNQTPDRNTMHSHSSPEILDRVNEQFDIYLSTGNISQKEMELFHSQISRLSPKDRTTSLSRLAKLINRGEIKFTH